MLFEGKTAVITGVSRGIGLALAQGFQSEGALVAGIDLHPCAESLPLFLRGDLAQKETLDQFADAVIEKFGRVDILINNAMMTSGGLDDCGYEGFTRALQIGVAAPYYLVKRFEKVFGAGASVLNLSSTRAFQSQRNTESYTAAKGGITALTHALAVTLSGKARVNAIAPGGINTTGGEFAGADSAQHPVSRVGAPRDIVEAAFFLCSDKAGFITGQTLVVDGGMSRLMVYHGDEGWALNG